MCSNRGGLPPFLDLVLFWVVFFEGNGFTRQCVRFFVLDCSWLASNWSSTRIIYVWFWMLFAANASGLKIHWEHKNGHQSGVGILNGQDTHTIQGALFPKQKLKKLLLPKWTTRWHDRCGRQPKEKGVKRLKRHYLFETASQNSRNNQDKQINWV